MTFDWQTPIVIVAILGAFAYLAYTLWPRGGDDEHAGCGSCSSGCDKDAADPETKPQARPIVPVEDLLKKR